MTIIPPTPDLRVLSEILRAGPSDPRWPEGFEWDYSDCRQCALEVVNQLWLRRPSPVWLPSMVEAFGIPYEAAYVIFAGTGGRSREAQRRVTSTEVADAIDAYLARSAP